MVAKLRCLFAALLCLVPALAWGQPGPSPGNITTPQATDFVPLYGRGSTGPLFGQIGNLVAPLTGLPNTWTALQTFSGGAIVPTRPLGDSTTNAANTAFVQAALANLIAIPNTWAGLQTLSAGINATGSGATTGAKFGSAATATWPQSLYSFSTSFQTIDIVDPSGLGAVAFASRDSDWTAGLINPSITESLLSVHDRTTAGPPGKWAAYWQCQTTAGAYTISFQHLCGELSFQNLGASVVADPFTINPSGFSTLLRLDSGIGPSIGNPVSNALQILPNGNTLNAGISIASGALTAQSGVFRAIEFPTNYSLVWFSSAATVTGYMTIDNSAVFQLVAAGGINTNGLAHISSLTAIPVGGTVNGYTFSSTANYGMFFGSGAPSISAAQGSIYLRSDGGAGTLLYTNTNGSTTWAPIPSGVGVSQTCTVNTASPLTLIFTNGILTGGTCNT